MAGVGKHVLLLLGIVLVIGTGLSTLVYRPGKRGMRMDLIIILLVELAAIVYVGSLLFERRPQHLVFVIDRFQVISAYTAADYPYRFPELERTHPVGPLLASARFPEDQEERASLKKAILFDGEPDIDVRPDHWYSFESSIASVLEAAGSLEEFSGRGEGQRAAVEHWLGAQKDGRDFLVLPVVGKIKDVTAVINPATGYPVAMLDVDPWE